MSFTIFTKGMWSASRLLMIVAINAMFPLLSVAQNESTQANTVVPDSTMNAVSRVTRLSEKEAHLNEVIVEGSNRIEKEDKVVYLPTRHQRSAAHNVANLLFNMMIPQIDVSLTDGSVKSIDGSRLLVCIDGSPTTHIAVVKVCRKYHVTVENRSIKHIIGVLITGPVQGGGGETSLSILIVRNIAGRRSCEGRICPVTFTVNAATDGFHLHLVSGFVIQTCNLIRIGGITDNIPRNFHFTGFNDYNVIDIKAEPV